MFADGSANIFDKGCTVHMSDMREGGEREEGRSERRSKRERERFICVSMCFCTFNDYS